MMRLLMLLASCIGPEHVDEAAELRIVTWADAERECLRHGTPILVFMNCHAVPIKGAVSIRADRHEMVGNERVVLLYRRDKMVLDVWLRVLRAEWSDEELTDRVKQAWEAGR